MSASGPGDIQGYQRQLEQAVQEKGLTAFYGPGTPGAQRLPSIAARAAQQVDRLCQAWRIQREIATDIVRLALYDVVIYIDDSGSMSFEENGERIKDLQLILQRVAFAATLFDDDGIDLRFMNDDSIPPNMLSGIRTEQQIDQIMQNKRYKGLTPFGTELRKKVIDPILIPKLNGNMQKPLLIISITDGQPAGENQNELMNTVRYAVGACRDSRYQQGAVAFQFAQVGNDQKATEFLGKLDNDPIVGREVDCTSSMFDHTTYSHSQSFNIPRLRKRIRGNGACPAARQPYPRSLDDQVNPRRHRSQLRYQGRESQYGRWRWHASA